MKRTPLKKISKKQRGIRLKLKDLSRRARMRAMGRCEYLCGRAGTEASHVYTRGAYPELAHSINNVLWACRGCHDRFEGGTDEHKGFLKANYPDRYEELQREIEQHRQSNLGVGCQFYQDRVCGTKLEIPIT